MPSENDQVPAPRDRRAAQAQTAFSIHAERVDDVYRLKARGELDLATCEALSAELERAQASDAKRIVLDLSDLTFIDSTGIVALVEANRRSATSGKRLQLFPVSGQVHDVFELTGLMRDFSFVTRP